MHTVFLENEVQASEKNYGAVFSTEVKAACTHSANLERETEITKIVTYLLFPLAFSSAFREIKNGSEALASVTGNGDLSLSRISGFSLSRVSK